MISTDFQKITCANGEVLKLTPELAKQEEAYLYPKLCELRDKELYTDKWGLELNKAALEYVACLDALGKYSEAMDRLQWAARYAIWGDDGDELHPSKIVVDTFRATYEICSHYADTHPEIRQAFDEDEGLHDLYKYMIK